MARGRVAAGSASEPGIAVGETGREQDRGGVADAPAEGQEHAGQDARGRLPDQDLQRGLEAGRPERGRGVRELAGHEAHDLVDGPGHDRELEQRHRQDAGQERGPQAQGQHDHEAEGAVDDGGHAPEHVEGEPGPDRRLRGPALVDVEVEGQRQAQEEGQGGRPEGEIERPDDGVQDAALLAQVVAALGASGSAWTGSGPAPISREWSPG